MFSTCSANHFLCLSLVSLAGHRAGGNETRYEQNQHQIDNLSFTTIQGKAISLKDTKAVVVVFRPLSVRLSTVRLQP